MQQEIKCLEVTAKPGFEISGAWFLEICSSPNTDDLSTAPPTHAHYALA